MDDLDDLLPGLNTHQDVFAERLGLDPFDEIAGHLEIDIGLQQGHAHFAQGLAHVVLGNLAEAAQVLERLLELAAERIEHSGPD